jgi:energy-coupling factor transport system permease protein
LVNTFKRADELAMAMDVRCYNGHSGRTKYNKMTSGFLDWFVLLSIIAFFAVVIFIDKLLV